MEHWQQMFLRGDPWSSIPWAAETGLNVDAKVGLVCLAAVVIVWIFGG